MSKLQEAVHSLGHANHGFRHAIWIVDAKVVELGAPMPQDQLQIDNIDL
jgi:hypothetical protein